jgi:RNA polymerase sigma-70 factor (ECF subfamily)
MRGEKLGQTIQATEPVHETYLRLVGEERIEWQGRPHVLAMAATSMCRVLVDHAGRKMAEKYGGGGEKIQWKKLSSFLPKSQKLGRLGCRSQVLRRDVPAAESCGRLRFFGGLEMEDIARMKGVSVRAVKQDWSVARAWLHHEIARGK